MTTPTAQQVFDKAFQPGRALRSDAYKQGVIACLRVRLDGAKYAGCPYEEGSAESDAYFAGVSEGRELSPVGSAPVGFDGPVVMTF
jgi:hypothetical protein